MKFFFRTYKNHVYIDDQNKILVVPGEWHYIEDEEKTLYKFLSDCGYKRPSIDSAKNIIVSLDGEPIEAVREIFKKRAEKANRIREHYENEYLRHQEQVKKYGNVFIGIDRHVDDFDTGFSVFALMNSKYTRKQQAEYIRQNKKDFIGLVAQEIKRKCKNKYSDLLPFCTITNITVGGRNETVITFELKEKLQSILKGE